LNIIEGGSPVVRRILFSAPLDIIPGRIKLKRKHKGKGIHEASHGFVPVK
jgi:hypothetical protein